MKKGNNSKNIMIFFLQFFIKYSIHHPLSADTSFKFLAIILFQILHLQNFIPCLSKGRNLTRGDNSGKTKNMRRLFFHEKSIHEVSRRYLHAPYTHTNEHTDKPKPICPPLFQSWGHNETCDTRKYCPFRFRTGDKQTGRPFQSTGKQCNATLDAELCIRIRVFASGRYFHIYTAGVCRWNVNDAPYSFKG